MRAKNLYKKQLLTAYVQSTEKIIIIIVNQFEFAIQFNCNISSYDSLFTQFESFVSFVFDICNLNIVHTSSFELRASLQFDEHNSIWFLIYVTNSFSRLCINHYNLFLLFLSPMQLKTEIHSFFISFLFKIFN